MSVVNADTIHNAAGTGAPAFTTGINITPINLSDSDATKLGLKVYSSGTTYNGGNAPTITLSSGGGTLSSVTYSRFYPRQTQDGNWELDGIWRVAMSSTARTTANFNVAGFHFPTTDEQPLYAHQIDSGTIATAYAYASESGGSINQFIIAHSSLTTNFYLFAFQKLKLLAKPTWAY